MQKVAGMRFGVCVAGLVAVLAIATGLFAREAMGGGPLRAPALLAGAETPTAYPRVVRFLAAFDPEHSRLRLGDRLRRAGAHDLQGAGAIESYARLLEAARSGVVEVEVERGGQNRVLRETLASERHLWRDAALGLAFAATALLLLRRAPASATARSFTLAALTWAIAQMQFQSAAPVQTQAYFVIRTVVGSLWAPLMILAALQFPEGAHRRGNRLPLWPWAFGLLGVTWISCWTGVPIPTDLALRLNSVVGSLVIAAVLVVITRNYGRVGPEGRRQVRWVLLGHYVALAPTLAGTLLGGLYPELEWLWFASQITLVAIPLSIYIAVTRSHMLDIDRLITGAGSYTVLLVALGATALTALPRLAALTAEQSGLDASVTQIAIGALLVFATVKLEPFVRPFIERSFFRERHALQTGIDDLITEINACEDAVELARLAGERLDDLLRPEFSVIYARSVDAFAPVLTRRASITPHFEVNGSLSRELGGRVSALHVEHERGWLHRLEPADRAALRGLAPAVLLPVTREAGLQGFFALGRKSSGDIYTSTDLALLGMVGAAVSAALMRFGGAELLEGARRLQEQLRQYVPASIASHLVEGRRLEEGERWVSVLFADLRGYTSLAEGRLAREIFEIVSRYTEAVTRIVTELGGTVVEFNGDGMMAVFGAPDPLPDQERRALAAARRIITEVSALKTPTLAAAGGRLSVGVGLATGSAYVGAIRSVDRRIWSAIGTTTNLAARLQTLTREFGSPIVIDSETHDAARDEAKDFVKRPGTEIRGLHETHDIYVLAAA